MDKNQTGSEIARLRIDAGLSQRKLAELCDVTNTYISKIEHGATSLPSKQTLIKIANACGVDYKYFLQTAGFCLKCNGTGKAGGFIDGLV